MTVSPDASERALRYSDLDEGDYLRDKVFDVDVEVAAVHVGVVRLRYPWQDDITHQDDVPDDSAIESYTYQWPLDGHRFEKK